MGGRGPQRTPTPRLINRGSPVGRARRKLEPQPLAGKRPTCPRWMSLDAKKIWRKVLPELDALGVLFSIDSYAIARYCILLKLWRQAAEEVEIKGVTVKHCDALNNWSKRPTGTFKALGVISESLLRLEDRFGLSPSARARLAVDVSLPVSSSLDGLLDGGRHAREAR